MEVGKQRKEGVGMNGYRLGNNGGVGREVVVEKKRMKGRIGRKEMRQKKGWWRTSKGRISRKEGRKSKRDKKKNRGMMGRRDRNEWNGRKELRGRKGMTDWGGGEMKDRMEKRDRKE